MTNKFPAFDRYSLGNRMRKTIKQDPTHYGPVKMITPPDTMEPADIRTIAVILLRRHNKLYKEHKKDPDLKYLSQVYYNSAQRELTEEEARKSLAILTWLRGRE